MPDGQIFFLKRNVDIENEYVFLYRKSIDMWDDSKV